MNLAKMIKLGELDDFLTFSVGPIIQEIKKNLQFSQRLRKIDSDFFKHLSEANRILLNRMNKEKYYFDLLVFRNLLCMYFSSHDFIPFKFSKKIPEKAVVQLLTKIDKIDIQKTCEVFLRVIFDKITPKKTFSFEEEFRKIRFCSKLYSMKRVHVKRFLISTFYSSSVNRSNFKGLIEKGKTNLKNTPKSVEEQKLIHFSDKMSEKGVNFSDDFAMKYRTNLIVVQDGYLTMTCNEMIGLFNINLMSGTFFASLPEGDLRQMSMMIAEKDLTKIPVVEELMKMERERNQLIMKKRLLDMKKRKVVDSQQQQAGGQEHDSSSQMGSFAGLGSEGRVSGLSGVDGVKFVPGHRGGDVGGVSTCSDFSFNLVGSRSMAFNLFNF